MLLPRTNVERGRELPEKTKGPDWTIIRAEVVAAVESRLLICERHGITLEQLTERIRTHKWNVPEDASEADRLLLLRKLFVGLERQLARLREAMVAKPEDQVSAMQKLTATYTKLLELERRINAGKPERRQSPQMQELRARIAKRLEELGVR